MRALFLVAALCLGAACSSSPSTQKCSTSTCTGCCDATGTCLAGNVESGCGTSGLSCVQCGTDTFCNLGFCVPRGSNTGGSGGGATGGGAGTGGGTGTGGGGATSCGAESCGGCCANGVCQPGNQATACGASGQTCASCPGGTCSNNRCVGSVCTSANCQGCCNGTRCETGLTAAACGSRGATCSGCDEAETCTNGSCTGVSTCNATTCPTGCCEGNVCQPGSSTSACGAAGLSCNRCGSNQSCQSGACTGGSTCNAATCPSGCCVGNVCQPGTTTSACGAGGASCSTCSSGDSCTNGQCTFTCNAATCPTGCCAGNVCQPGTAANACGDAGNACSTCGLGQSCSNKQCVGGCNATTCPSGCCQGVVCQAGSTSAACGNGGASCTSCGTSQACNGTQCVAVCNAATCPSGCCQGDVCLPGASSSACGVGGGACQACGSGTSCASGNCVGSGPVGDGCDTAPLLTLPVSVTHSLVGYGNTFVSGTANGCRGTQGIDRAVRVLVPAGQRLTVTVTPTGMTFDPAVSLVVGGAAACVGASAQCVASIDVGNAGVAETVSWTNAGTAATTVYVIVDDYSPTGTNGAYTLAISAAAPAAGESCVTPLNATSGVAVSRTPSSFANDYQGTGTGCFTPSTGPDFVLAYSVPNNRSLTVTATPAAGLDVSLNFATSVGACDARSCVAGGNAGAEGVAETVAWNNTTGATVTLFVLIDAPTSPVGAVSVVGTEGALVACGASTCASGCCAGGQCVTGSSNAACGTGGATCSSCTSPALCNNNRVCSASDLPTGSTCSASSQCYQPVFGTAECRTTWPAGYCTGSCFLTNQVCGGFLGLASGWCTPGGECLKDCSSPGGGQGTCRSNYVCEFSNGAGSQGVCVPRCQSVSCTSGSCNAAGYCR